MPRSVSAETCAGRGRRLGLSRFVVAEDQATVR